MTRQFLNKQLEKSEAGKAYLLLVEKASRSDYNLEKKRIEVHHIVPRCLQGTNDSENLIALTVYDHILAHYYLARALGSKRISLLKAFGCMCNWHLPTLSELEQVTLLQLEEWGRLRNVSKEHSFETKQKISKATRGKRKIRTKPVTQETKDKIRNYQKGRPKSKEHRKHISEAKQGKPGGFTGKQHSDQTKEKMSLSHIGKQGNFTGKQHSEKTKLKMSKAHRGRKLSEEDRLHKSEAQKRRWAKYRDSNKFLT